MSVIRLWGGSPFLVLVNDSSDELSCLRRRHAVYVADLEGLALDLTRIHLIPDSLVDLRCDLPLLRRSEVTVPDRQLALHDRVPKRRNKRDHELGVVAHLGVWCASGWAADTGELPEVGLTAIMMVGLTADLDERPAREDVVIVP